MQSAPSQSSTSLSGDAENLGIAHASPPSPADWELAFGLVACAAGWAVSHDRAGAWKREALREARRTVEVPSLFPPGPPRAGESLPWHALAVEAEARAASLGAQGVEVAERRELKKRGERIRDLEHTVRELEANREESGRITTRREFHLKQEKDTAYSERNRLAVALARVGLALGCVFRRW